VTRYNLPDPEKLKSYKMNIKRSNSPVNTLIMDSNLKNDLSDHKNEILTLARLIRFDNVMKLGDFENDCEFAKAIRVSEDSIAQIRRSGAVPSEITKNLSLYLGISDVWFDKGTGEVFLEGSITTDSEYLQLILNDPVTKLTYTNFHAIENGSETSGYLLIDSITKIAEKRPNLTVKELLERIRVMMYKTETIYQQNQLPPTAE
jgi:hypothetical protein